MTTKPDDLAKPQTVINHAAGTVSVQGLTKREHFAALAMQGLASKDNSTKTVAICAHIAVEMADALIAALNKPQRGA